MQGIADFFRIGGWSMFLVLLFTAFLLYVAGRFAFTPTPKRLALTRSLSLALLFAVLGGAATNLMAVSRTATSERFAHSADLPAVVIGGIGESIAPAVLGFTALSFAWLFVAVGTRRRDDLNQEP